MSDETTILAKKRDVARLEKIKARKDLGSNGRTLRFLLDHYEATAQTADA